ncbi:hypothetical protein [Lampropedia puyangensis]|uniref:hypothetical protein n=1 Tax=Lampropedia puyangensis TaxID=1330072 RepID=UPI001FCEF7BA|nr:hypothetical protein [Lampropedia puyangensis]
MALTAAEAVLVLAVLVFLAAAEVFLTDVDCATETALSAFALAELVLALLLLVAEELEDLADAEVFLLVAIVQSHR